MTANNQPGPKISSSQRFLIREFTLSMGVIAYSIVAFQIIASKEHDEASINIMAFWLGDNHPGEVINTYFFWGAGIIVYIFRLLEG